MFPELYFPNVDLPLKYLNRRKGLWKEKAACAGFTWNGCVVCTKDNFFGSSPAGEFHCDFWQTFSKVSKSNKEAVWKPWKAELQGQRPLSCWCALIHSCSEWANSAEKMQFEDLSPEIGGFGRFQILILFILCLPRIKLPMHFLLHNFLAATPSHHCAILHQEAFMNLSMEEVLLISIPREPDGTFRSCEMFSQPQFHLLLNSSLEPESNSTVQHCQHGWVYDHSQFTSTISTQVTPGLWFSWIWN